MANLRGTDIIGQGLLQGIPGLADALAKHVQERQRQQELNTIVQGLIARSQGTPQKMGTDIGSLPIPAQQGTPMFDPQNFGALGRLGEISPQTLGALAGTQPKPYEVAPGNEYGNRTASGDYIKKGTVPQKEVKSANPQWPLIKTENAKGPQGQSGTTYFYGNPQTKEVYKTEFHSLGGAAASTGGPAKSRKDLVDRFNRDPNVRKAVTVSKSADELIALAASNNPISNNAIATIAARASGEVGNLSEADKAPFGGSQSILARLQQLATTGYSGLKTPENKQFITGLAEAFKRSGQNMKEGLADDWANQYSSASTELGSYDEIMGYLLPSASRVNKPMEPVQPELSGKDKQALDWAKANPNDPRSAKILQKLGRQ
jgi:hypothetical protein